MLRLMRPIFLVALVVTCSQAIASPGVYVYLALYEYDPIGFTENYATACSSAHPQLADRLTNAFAIWKTRNTEAATKVAQAFDAEIRKKWPTEEEWRANIDRIKQLQSEVAGDWSRVAESMTRCEELLEGLETGKADVERVLK